MVVHLASHARAARSRQKRVQRLHGGIHVGTPLRGGDHGLAVLGLRVLRQLVLDLRRQLDLDKEAVSLREAIYSKSMKKVKLGTETVNEMLRDAIAVSQARQQQSLHNIQLQQAICQQKTLQGR